MVRDATSTTLCRIGEQETVWAAVGGLKAWLEKHGLPRALYTDRKSVYVREPRAKELLHGQHQDRLAKQLRRKKIAAYQTMNQYLEQGCCDDHQRRFAIDACSEVDYHLPAPGAKK